MGLIEKHIGSLGKNSLKKFLTSIKSKLFLILPAALLVLSNIFLFGAATIYRGNTSEFGIDLLYALEFYALPFIILLFIFLGIGILLSRRFLSIYVSLIFTLALLLWIQGNLLLWEYGVFDGLGIEWSRYSWQGWVDAGLWIILLIAAIIFHRKISRSVTCFLARNSFNTNIFYCTPNLVVKFY